MPTNRSPTEAATRWAPTMNHACRPVARTRRVTNAEVATPATRPVNPAQSGVKYALPAEIATSPLNSPATAAVTVVVALRIRCTIR